jgi:hypothetical protein
MRRKGLANSRQTPEISPDWSEFEESDLLIGRHQRNSIDGTVGVPVLIGISAAC